MIVVLLGAAALFALAQDHARTPWDDDFNAAGAAHNVPPNLLRAIAFVESHLIPGAVSNPNADGTRDYGLMQLNERTLERLGISTTDALNPTVSIGGAASLLARVRLELGSRFSALTWAAAYNVGSDLLPRSIGDAYAARVLYHWLLFDIGRLGT